MTKKRSWLGVLVTVLAFGMMVFGCDDGSTDSGKLATPQGLTATALSSSSVRLQWNSVSGTTEYWIERREGESGSFGGRKETTSTNYTYTELKADTTYYFRVAAFKQGGLSDYSTAVSATTNGYSKPPMPSIATATAVNGSSNSVKITWSAVTVTDSYTPNYRVYYKKGTLAATPTDLTEATSSYPVSGTEYTITGLDALTDYAFCIRQNNHF
jgi:fibronectin type 3 domain-containing protein